MKKSDIQPMPAYFDRYINLVEDINLEDAFDKSVRQLNEIDLSRLLEVGSSVYAPGKWTLNDIIAHMADTERIFDYRALRFARGDRTPLQGFDQDLFASHATADDRPLADLLDELKVLRRSTVSLFRGFDRQMLLRSGKGGPAEISVLAIGYTIIGHQIHHLGVIEEKYLPLAKTGTS
jgi:hypothetical protein